MVTKENVIKLIEAYSKDTWNGIEQLAKTKTGFPLDRLALRSSGEANSSISSPTNIGIYLASLVGSRDLKLISDEAFREYLELVLSSLEQVKTYEGLYYNWYNTETGEFDSRFNNFISTVDNAWLAAGLIVIRKADPNYKDRVNRLLSRINISLIYDYERELFRGGFDVDASKPTKWHYGVLNTEARIASYIGINEFGIGWNHYGHLRRPSIAKNKKSKKNKPLLFQSWGGSMFEALMPTLFMPEHEMSHVWKQSHMEYINEQIRYGMKNSKGFWGYSPAEDPNGKYREFGVPKLAIKRSKVSMDPVITPYAIFLTLPFVPKKAIDNLLNLRTNYPDMYSDGFGFADSVNIETGAVSQSYLSLDQEMSFIAQYNYLSNNKTYEYFGSQLNSSVGNILKVLDFEASLGLYN